MWRAASKSVHHVSAPVLAAVARGDVDARADDAGEVSEALGTGAGEELLVLVFHENACLGSGGGFDSLISITVLELGLEAAVACGAGTGRL
jgi:hypothetical protein